MTKFQKSDKVTLKCDYNEAELLATGMQKEYLYESIGQVCDNKPVQYHSIPSYKVRMLSGKYAGYPFIVPISCLELVERKSQNHPLTTIFR